MAIKNRDLYSASFLIKELNVSDKYLKRILTTLSHHSIIQSVQGRYGGFRLGKSADNINLYEIVNAVEDIDKYIGCVLGLGDCSDESPCSLHDNWIVIKEQLIHFLKETTIAEVVKNPNIIKF